VSQAAGPKPHCAHLYATIAESWADLWSRPGSNSTALFTGFTSKPSALRVPPAHEGSTTAPRSPRLQPLRHVLVMRFSHLLPHRSIDFCSAAIYVGRRLGEGAFRQARLVEAEIGGRFAG
jgi:hypothetical protein